LPPIINAQKISKAFGAKPLFQNVSFTVSEGSRIGLIGPNGSGKSTLMRILAGTDDPDSGIVAIRKRLRLSYVAQDSHFDMGESIRAVIESTQEFIKY
jgi:ABC transport system ATP-binding/permease protein